MAGDCCWEVVVIVENGWLAWLRAAVYVSEWREKNIMQVAKETAKEMLPYLPSPSSWLSSSCGRGVLPPSLVLSTVSVLPESSAVSEQHAPHLSSQAVGL